MYSRSWDCLVFLYNTLFEPDRWSASFYIMTLKLCTLIIVKRDHSWNNQRKEIRKSPSCSQLSRLDDPCHGCLVGADSGWTGRQKWWVALRSARIPGRKQFSALVQGTLVGKSFKRHISAQFWQWGQRSASDRDSWLWQNHSRLVGLCCGVIWLGHSL